MENSADLTPPSDQQGKRVLIIEDDPNTATAMAELLEGLGCETSIVGDGTLAVGKALEFEPHIVLLDIGLPNMDGYQVAHELRHTPGLTGVLIVAITGYGEPEDKQKAYSAGIDLHLTKPVRIKFLRELVSVYGK